MESSEILTFDSITLNLVARKLFINGCQVFLRNKEFGLLEYFIRNSGRVLTRTQLLEEVWDRNICCATNTIDVHVSNLRRKCKKNSGSDFIRTVHCIGYIFEH